MPTGSRKSIRKPKPKYQPGGRGRKPATPKRSAPTRGPRMNTLDQMREQDANALAKPATVPAPTMEGARGLFREQKLLTLDHVKLLLDEIDQADDGLLRASSELITDKMSMILEQSPSDDTES
jgi:hypothetical protein